MQTGKGGCKNKEKKNCKRMFLRGLYDYMCLCLKRNWTGIYYCWWILKFVRRKMGESRKVLKWKLYYAWFLFIHYYIYNFTTKSSPIFAGCQKVRLHSKNILIPYYVIIQECVESGRDDVYWKFSVLFITYWVFSADFNVSHLFALEHLQSNCWN